MHIHLVFSTKTRVPIITEDWREDLYNYMAGIVKNQGATCLAIGGISDHVHLLIGLTPSHRLDYFMRELKAGSSGWARREKNSKFAWQKGYGGFAVSATNLEKVKSYIHNQETHHKTRSFQDEYLELLKISGIDYDEKHLW